jgi:GNAT superfamily N-acetyltransferase
MARDEPSSVTVVRVEQANDIDLAALSRLFESVSMRPRPADRMSAAIAGSTDVYAAYDGKTLVGFGRMVSDSVFYGSIWDMAVEPSMQHRGIGASALRPRQGARDPRALHGIAQPGILRKVRIRVSLRHPCHDELHDELAEIDREMTNGDDERIFHHRG